MDETEETEREGRPPANLVALVAEFEAEQRDAEGLALLDWVEDGIRINGGPPVSREVALDFFRREARPGGGGGCAPSGSLSFGPFDDEFITVIGDGVSTPGRYPIIRQSVARRSLGR